MKDKKKPQRTCVACRQMQDKANLVRIVKSPDGEVTIDETGKKNGRGAYLCKSKECIEKSRKSKALQRALDCDVSDEIYAKLLEELN